MPEWGPRKAGSDGDDAGPVGCGGAAEPKLLLKKLPINDEAGEFPINPLPAGCAKERKKKKGRKEERVSAYRWTA